MILYRFTISIPTAKADTLCSAIGKMIGSYTLLPSGLGFWEGQEEVTSLVFFDKELSSLLEAGEMARGWESYIEKVLHEQEGYCVFSEMCRPDRPGEEPEPPKPEDIRNGRLNLLEVSKTCYYSLAGSARNLWHPAIQDLTHPEIYFQSAAQNNPALVHQHVSAFAWRVFSLQTGLSPSICRARFEQDCRETLSASQVYADHLARWSTVFHRWKSGNADTLLPFTWLRQYAERELNMGPGI